MKAIQFDLGADKLLSVRYGESQFKLIDDFWVDFTPDGGEKTTAFLANIVKRTDKNEKIVNKLIQHYAEQKAMNDEYDREMYKLRNQFEK